jgi:hypothetical protein
MLLVYQVALVVVLSTTPGAQETVIFSFPTWSECKSREAELIAGMKNKRSEAVTADCRRGVRIDMGSR